MPTHSAFSCRPIFGWIKIARGEQCEFLDKANALEVSPGILPSLGTYHQISQATGTVNTVPGINAQLHVFVGQNDYRQSFNL